MNMQYNNYHQTTYDQSHTLAPYQPQGVSAFPSNSPSSATEEGFLDHYERSLPMASTQWIENEQSYPVMSAPSAMNYNPYYYYEQASYPAYQNYQQYPTITSTPNAPMSTYTSTVPSPNDYSYSSKAGIASYTPSSLLIGAELRGRAENWNYEETKKFVDILISNRTQFQNIRRFPGLWDQISTTMESAGYKRTVDKCKNRWKVLVAKYKKCHMELVKNERAGNGRPMCASSMFEFFDEVQSLLYQNYVFGPNGVSRRFKTSSSALPSHVASTQFLQFQTTQLILPKLKSEENRKPY